jgi:hypothetical protein
MTSWVIRSECGVTACFDDVSTTNVQTSEIIDGEPYRSTDVRDRPRISGRRGRIHGITQNKVAVFSAEIAPPHRGSDVYSCPQEHEHTTEAQKRSSQSGGQDFQHETALFAGRDANEEQRGDRQADEREHNC